MSGGHFDYKYHQLDWLADGIENTFVNDGKFTEDWGSGVEERDRIGDATEEERVVILAEVKSLMEDLRKCAKRAKELEWYMSGDTGATTYLERLEKINKEFNG